MKGLVLSRFSGESITIGESIVVQIIAIRGDKVRLKVHAPIGVPVHRKEVFEACRRRAGALGVPLAQVPGFVRDVTG